MCKTEDYIEIPVSLGVDDKTRHWLYFRQNPRTDEERSQSIHKTDIGGATTFVQAKVHNGRSKSKSNDELTLDDASFELVDCPTALSTEDFYALQDMSHPKCDELKEKYYKEVADFVKRTVGCDEVVVFHHQVRSSKGGNGVQPYAGGVPHTDSSPVSADELAMQMMSMSEPNEGHDDKNDEDAEEPNNSKKYKRYMYLNLWRNISDDHPIENDHLAVLDERTTVKPDDYIAKDLFMDGSYSSVQYNLNARHASNHKWYYFPNMVKSEAILFKQMDSDWTKSGRICFHMSVNDANVKTETTPRESIEARMFCYWKEPDSGVDSMPTNENTNIAKVQGPQDLAVTGGSLKDASNWQLLKTLWGRLFFVGKLIGTTSSTSNQKSTYSGDPKDYVLKFTAAIDAFPAWPKLARSWASGEMKNHENVMDGIHAITKAAVDDMMGYQGTNKFKAEEKKAIVDYLLGDEKYVELAKEHLSHFLISKEKQSNVER